MRRLRVSLSLTLVRKYNECHDIKSRLKRACTYYYYYYYYYYGVHRAEEGGEMVVLPSPYYSHSSHCNVPNTQ